MNRQQKIAAIRSALTDEQLKMLCEVIETAGSSRLEQKRKTNTSEHWWADVYDVILRHLAQEFRDEMP